ncbi:TPA: hypothetical protein ACH3X3_003049 [Trebouxia sp. C0006]
MSRTAEFCLLYCKCPGLCNACDWWDKFLQDTGRCIPNKAQSPWTAALVAWRLRAACRSQSAGPVPGSWTLCVCVFDRATTGNATMACTRVKRSNFARDSIMLTKSNGLDG